MYRAYQHQVRWEETGPDGRRQCGICGLPTTGAGPTLRHVGEAVRPTAPDRADVPAFTEAVRVATAACDRLTGVYPVDSGDYARVIVEALYREGALRTGRTPWRRRAAA